MSNGAKEAWSRRAFDWAYRHRAELSLVAAGLAWTAAGLTSGELALIGLALGAIFQFGAGYADRQTQRLLESARENVADARGDVRDAEVAADRARNLESKTLQVFLVNLMERYGLGPQERVSLYAYNGVDSLLQIERWSHDPVKMSQGRDTYPLGEGFLGEAWLDDVGERSRMPDPTSDLEAWCDAHERVGLTREVAEGLTMRSRSYYARALDAGEHGRVGVVVFESLDVDLPRKLRDNLATEDLEALARLTHGRRPDTAKTPATATQRGL